MYVKRGAVQLALLWLGAVGEPVLHEDVPVKPFHNLVGVVVVQVAVIGRPQSAVFAVLAVEPATHCNHYYLLLGCRGQGASRLSVPRLGRLSQLLAPGILESDPQRRQLPPHGSPVRRLDALEVVLQQQR